VRAGVNVAAAGLAGVILVSLPGRAAQENPARPHLRACEPLPATWFTPVRPQLGRYEVCATPDPIRTVAPPGAAIEALAPVDALGTAGVYDRAAVVRLYGGRRASVARGWIREAGRFEAFTLVSPYPDLRDGALREGTLVIRYFLAE
jgi:hypothetical protein